MWGRTLNTKRALCWWFTCHQSDKIQGNKEPKENLKNSNNIKKRENDSIDRGVRLIMLEPGFWEWVFVCTWATGSIPQKFFKSEMGTSLSAWIKWNNPSHPLCLVPGNLVCSPKAFWSWGAGCTWDGCVISAGTKVARSRWLWNECWNGIATIFGKRNRGEHFSGKRPKCLTQLYLRVNLVKTYDFEWFVTGCFLRERDATFCLGEVLAVSLKLPVRE